MTTTNDNQQPIRLPVEKYLDSAKGQTGYHSVEVPVVHITPAVAAQILALTDLPARVAARRGRDHAA